jgi:hypothetical protein
VGPIDAPERGLVDAELADSVDAIGVVDKRSDDKRR